MKDMFLFFISSAKIDFIIPGLSDSGILFHKYNAVSFVIGLFNCGETHAAKTNGNVKYNILDLDMENSESITP